MLCIVQVEVHTGNPAPVVLICDISEFTFSSKYRILLLTKKAYIIQKMLQPHVGSLVKSHLYYYFLPNGCRDSFVWERNQFTTEPADSLWQDGHTFQNFEIPMRR